MPLSGNGDAGHRESSRRDALAKVFTVGYDVFDHVQYGTDCNTERYNVGWSTDWLKTDDAILGELALDGKTADSYTRGSLRRYLFGGAKLNRKVPVSDGLLKRS